MQNLYSMNVKNRDFGKEDPQNLHSERGTIAERQGPSENANYEVNPTQPGAPEDRFDLRGRAPPKTDSSCLLSIYRTIFALLALIIPIEHKYDKPLRFFSKSLIPSELHLPKWFETKIYFYPSDLAAPFLILLAIIAFKIPLRRLFLERHISFLWAFLLFAILSIAASPFCNYPLLYIRLWQWLTAILLFCLASQRKEIVPTLLKCLIAAAILQSLFATAQYFHQGSFGLRILGEPDFNRSMESACALNVPGGYRWIIDRWCSSPFDTNAIVRVMGTTAHPNVLGGFLALTALASLGFFHLSLRKWLWASLIFIQLFAMTLTFSRGAIFAFGLGAFIWFIMNRKPFPYKALTLLLFSATTIGFLFQDQIIHRGGIVNYNQCARGSDAYRLKQQNLSLEMIQKHPFFGVGFQQFSIRAHEFLPIDPNTHVNGAHNIYLMIASEMGLLALFCFLAFLSSLFFSIHSAPHSPFLPSLTAMFIAFLWIGCCDFYPLCFQMGRLLFFITAGLLASQLKLPEKIAEERMNLSQ